MALLRPLAAAACLAASGCRAASLSMWSPRDVCLLDQPGHDALPAEEGPVDETGLHPRYSVDGRGVSMSVERKGCSHHLKVTTPKGSNFLGPYDFVPPDSIVAHPAKARYAFVARVVAKETRVIVDGVESQAYTECSKPVFSANGAHVGYVATLEHDTLMVLDGRPIARGGPKDGPVQLMAILDDGRAIFARRHPGDLYRLVAGDWTSEPYRNQSGFALWRGKRFSIFLGAEQRWEAVLDGRSEPVPGMPLHNVTFSNDGAHAMYVMRREHKDARGTVEYTYSVLVDGVEHAVPGAAGSNVPPVSFYGTLPVALLMSRRARPGAEALAPEPTGIFLIGRPAPAVPPTRDDFPRDRTASSATYYVQIGDSRGPVFDRVEPSSLFADERGRIHYQATRGRDTFDVIDNVIQDLPLAPPPAKKASDGPSPPMQKATDPAPQP